MPGQAALAVVSGQRPAVSVSAIVALIAAFTWVRMSVEGMRPTLWG